MEIINGFGNYASSVAAASRADVQKGFQGVVRAKGTLWIASAHAYPVDFHVAGRHIRMAPTGTPWMAARPEVRGLMSQAMTPQEVEMMKEIGLSPAMVFGDRKTEAVFIGVGMDKPSMLQALEDALLTDAEFAEGEAGWKELEDVFFGGELR